jgi:hypothetical protein
MTPELRIYDISATAARLRELGATCVTNHTVRMAIAAGRLAHLKIGKKFFTTEASIVSWLERLERKGRRS